MADLLVRVYPEYCSTGIWAIDEPGGSLGPNLHLRLTDDLRRRFEAWCALLDRCSPFSGDCPEIGWDAFAVEMIELARDLKAHLGPDAHVEYCVFGGVFAVGEPPN